MISFNMLLCAVVLVLGVSVEASFSSGSGNYNYNLSGQALTDLYNSRVYLAEKVVRPMRFCLCVVGVFSHSGVRVTLADGSQHLVHKGSGFGLPSKTVVTDARPMSSTWQVKSTRDFDGTKTVADFVRVGGSNYNVLTDNCHHAANRMMRQ